MRWRYKPSERKKKREAVRHEILMDHECRQDIVKRGRPYAVLQWGYARLLKVRST